MSASQQAVKFYLLVTAQVPEATGDRRRYDLKLLDAVASLGTDAHIHQIRPACLQTSVQKRAGRHLKTFR